MSFSTSKSATWIVLALSIVALAIPLVMIVSEVMEHTHGAFSYPLDDSYIHLAVAKNLTLNNVWGISSHEFASASSSILYPLLLSGIFKVIGVHTIVPFIVNCIAAVVFLVVVQKWLIRQDITPGGQLIVLFLGIFLTPLPVIVMISMEHTLHLLFFFLFLTSFAETLETKSFSSGKSSVLPWPVCIWGALMLAARFESMCLLTVACSILLFYKRWIMALQLGLIGFFPVLVFGIYSVSKGGLFLPNSVVLKSVIPPLNFADITMFLKEEYLPRFISSDERNNTLGVQRLLFLLPLAYLLLRRAIKENISWQYMLLMLMACTIFHISFTSFSFYARYEAYLIGCSVIIGSTLFVKYGKIKLNEKVTTPEAVTWLLSIFLLAPLVTRGWTAFDEVSLGATWIYDQQYQMGKFVQQYYDRDGVAFNDIGAVSYFSEGKKLDIMGLGNNDVAKRRKNHTNSPAFLDSMTTKKAVKIAIVYEPRFRPFLHRWQKVASWYVPYKNDISFYDSVSFYAVNPSEAPFLMDNLKKYQPNLPKEVIVKYY